MEISGSTRSVNTLADAKRSAVDGIRDQLHRLQQNTHAVARDEPGAPFAVGTQERALVEQHEILRAVKANARSLEVSNQVLGTIIDIKV